MKTRSQTRANGKAILNPDGVRQKDTKKLERYKWEHLEIHRVEPDEFTGSFIVVVKWPDGNISHHDKEEIYIKSPRKVRITITGPKIGHQLNVLSSIDVGLLRATYTFCRWKRSGKVGLNQVEGRELTRRQRLPRNL